MLSEESDNPADSVPPLIEGHSELSQFVQNIGCLARSLARSLDGASLIASYAAAQSSQEAPA